MITPSVQSACVILIMHSVVVIINVQSVPDCGSCDRLLVRSLLAVCIHVVKMCIIAYHCTAGQNTARWRLIKAHLICQTETANTSLYPNPNCKP